MTYDCIKIPSLNFSSRDGCPIHALIIHCIGLPLRETITGLTQSIQDGGLGVSSHYFIPQISGQDFAKEIGVDCNLMHPDKIPVIQFVDEKDKAWHAGQSWWKDLNDLLHCENTLNPCSIGIEFHAPGYDDTTTPHTFAPYTQDQMETGAALIKDIVNRHQIPIQNILGHNDIAPIRPDGTFKTDPGPLFPWDWLREQL